MNTSNLIDMTAAFNEERAVNEMVGPVIQDVSKVIYVDFKKKQVTKTVTCEGALTTVEYDTAC